MEVEFMLVLEEDDERILDDFESKKKRHVGDFFPPRRRL